jgi:predicted nucleotidyltransferase
MKIDAIVTAIRQKIPDIQAIYSFGSVAKGTNNANSDVDIAILPATKLAAVKRWEISTMLARLINRDVDLVDLSQASTVMRFQIVSTGKRVYSKNPLDSEKFEDLVYAFYIRFNDERKEILTEIRRRGQIL